MSFISLPTAKIHKEIKTKKLKNFPAGYVGKFYRNLVNNVDSADIANDADIPSSDVRKYLLATSDFPKGMQMDINHYVTRDRLNNASFRQRLDPISKNIFWHQNPLEIVFEDISTFDVQSPVAGSLLWELYIGKKDLPSKLIKKAPTPSVDLDIQKRLEALRKDNNKFNNNNAPLPPPSPPTFNNFAPPPQLLPPPPPLLFNSFQQSQYFPPPSSPPLPLPGQRPTARPSATQTQPSTQFGEMAMTKTKIKPEKEQVLEDIGTAIYEIPEPPKLEIGDPLLNFLWTDAEKVLADDYINDKELQDKIFLVVTMIILYRPAIFCL